MGFLLGSAFNEIRRPYHEIEVVNLFPGLFSDVNLDIHIYMVGILHGVFSKPGSAYLQAKS